jgi:hypothetical protein
MRERPQKRATEAQIAARTEEVLRIRLDGAEFWDLREYAREKEKEEGSAWFLAEGEPPMSDGQLRRYAQWADDLIAESCREEREATVRRHLAQRRNLYARAVNKGDERTALSVLCDEAKLLDLYPAARTKNEHSGPDGAPIPVAFIEVAAPHAPAPPDPDADD